MQSLSVGQSPQGGKIGVSVSYAIYVVACRRAHRRDSPKKVGTAALLDLSADGCRDFSVENLLSEQLVHFEHPSFEHVGHLGAPARVQTEMVPDLRGSEPERFTSCDRKPHERAHRQNCGLAGHLCPKSILSARPLVTHHFPRDFSAPIWGRFLEHQRDDGPASPAEP
jgi:hypothetical protein